ncbi:MAG: hypothetical protein WBQ66_20215, partial [Blastocatellia bacterium]
RILRGSRGGPVLAHVRNPEAEGSPPSRAVDIDSMKQHEYGRKCAGATNAGRGHDSCRKGREGAPRLDERGFANGEDG